MNIWLLSSELAGEHAGGIARYVDNYAAALTAAGHQVTVIARADGKPAPRAWPLVPVRPRLHLLPEPSTSPEPDEHPSFPYNLMDFWPAFSYQMRDVVLDQLARRPPPDVIESQDYGAIAYYLLQHKLTETGPLSTVPVVLHLHSPWFEMSRVNQEPRYRFPQYWVGQMEKFCMAAADGMIAPSRFLADRVRQTLSSHSLDIPVVPLPSSPASLNALDPQPNELLYVGRLEIRKGVLPLVKGCARLWQSGADFSLTLAGGDTFFHPQGVMVGDYIRQRYGPWIESGRLKLAGQLDAAAVRGAMSRAWAVIIPSVWENFPNVCMEAMQMGQVVLASRSGGQAEMIGEDGQAGFLFDWEADGDFERSLACVLKLDAVGRTAIGQRARDRIGGLCDPGAVIPQRIRHYQQVIASHTPRGCFPAAIPSSPGPSGLRPSRPGLLSVVVPYHNLGNYVEETLDSVLASTYQPLEVVLVDDGSTDSGSLEALQRIESRNPANVRVFHTENRGLAPARRHGAELALGEFLVLVDADDLVEPDFFARAIAVLQRYANVGFVYSWVRYFQGASGCWPTWNSELPYFLGHNMLTVVAVTRRAEWLAHTASTPAFAYNFEDYAGWLGMQAAGFAGVSLPQLLTRYRIRPESMYRRATREQFLYLHELLTCFHPDWYRQHGEEMFHLLNANGPAYAWSHPATASPEPAASYVAELERQRDLLRAEAQTLGRAWETHVRYIRAQTDYGQSLEARVGELMTLVQLHESRLAETIKSSARDYEIGGRLIARLRKVWLVKLLLRSARLKRTIRRLLGG